MRLLKPTLLLLFLCSIAGCSSAEKSSEELSESSAQAGANLGESTEKMTREDVLQKYSTNELASAANAFSALAQRPESSIPNCELSGNQASRYATTTRSLVEEKVREEREAYVADPVVYARDHGFETCAANCSCGVWAQMLEPIEVSLIKNPAKQKAYMRSLQRLKAKSGLQTAEASWSCAQKQTWLCKSELAEFLAGQVQETEK